MSADVTALKSDKGEKFTSTAQFKKRLIEVKLLYGLRLHHKVSEKTLMFHAKRFRDLDLEN